MQQPPIGTHLFGRVLDDTTNSYKFFWTQSLLSIAHTKGDQPVSVREMIARMLASAWHTVLLFKLSLGRNDKLQDAILAVQRENCLAVGERYPVVLDAILESPVLNELVDRLSRYVPTRFLTPWFELDLQGFAYGAAVERWATNIPVLTGKPVSQVFRSKDGVVVTTGRKTVRVSAAVITVPIGVLKSRSITFEPPLPKCHRRAIDGLQMANLEKVSILFRDPVKKPSVAHAGFYVLRRGRAMYALWHPTGKFVTCFFGGKVARDVCDLSDTDAKNYALQELSEGLKPILLSSSIRDLAKRVERRHVTRWGKDRYSLGSDSAARIGCSESRTTLSLPVEGQLFFAGEATHLEWAARVYGAYESGIKAANLVDKAIGKARRPRGP